MFEVLKSHSSCKTIQAMLEDLDDPKSLPPALAEHAAKCPDCRAAIEEFAESRALFAPLRAERNPAHPQVQPWFASRVMAAIAERESKLEDALEAWSAVPRFASRFAWVSALALLLTTSWLLERQPQPKQMVVTDLAGESALDRHPTPANNDEVLFSLAERTND
jgi:hypothetical protein